MTEALEGFLGQSSAPQGRDLRPHPGGAAGGQTQLLQHVGRGREQHAQLVGQETRATGAVEGDVEQSLDAVLDLAPLAVASTAPAGA